MFLHQHVFLIIASLTTLFAGHHITTTYTVDLVIFACSDLREFVILGFFTKSRISELSISMIGSAHNNNFPKIPNFANLSS